MRQFIAKNVLFLILVNIIIKPFWIFGIDTQVQNAVGNETYGAYLAFFNLCLIFQIILDIGLQSYTTNTVAKSHHTFQTLFPNIIVGKLILSGLYLIIVGCTGLALGYNWQAIGLLYLVSFIQIASSFLLFFRSNIAAFQRFAVDSFLSVFDRLLLIISCGLLLYVPVWKHLMDIHTFILLQIACLTVACLVAAIFCFRLMKINWQKVHLKKISVIVKQSLPYALLIFSMAIFIRVDTLLVQFFLGNHSVGLYGAAFRLLDVINNSSGVLIAGVLLPFFAKNSKEHAHIADIIALFTHLLLPFSLLIAIIVWYWQADIMQLLYKDNDPDYSYMSLGILLLAYPFYCLNYIYSTLLTANGNIRFLIKISIIGIIINIALNCLLMPMYNIIGTAIASLATIAFVAIVCTAKVQQLFRLEVWDYKFLSKTIFYAAFVIIIGNIFQATAFNFLIQIMCMVIIGMSLLPIMGFIDFKAFKTYNK